MADKIIFDVEVGKNELNSALDSGAKKASGLGDVLKTAAGVFAGNLATKGFELLTQAIGNTVAFAKESIHAFTEQEDALNKLSQALRASGDFSDEAVSDFSAFASELQRTSKFGDEVVLSQLAIAKSLGATNVEAKKMVQAAAEMSAAFGGSLDENLLKIGKTLSGEVGRLGQLVPELKSLTREQLRSAEAADLILSKFGGSAASELNTYSGSVIASANAFSDLQEEIGGVIVDVLHLKDINNFLKSVYETLTEKVLGFRDSLKRGDKDFKENEGSINRLSGEFAKLTEEIEIQESRLRDYKEQAKTSFSAAGEVSFAKQNIKELTKEQEKLFETINKFKSEEEKSAGSGKTRDTRTKEEIDRQTTLNDELLSLKQSLETQKLDIETQAENQKITNEFARNAAEIERIAAFEAQKAELDAELKAKKAETQLSGDEEDLALKKIQLEKELAQNKIYSDKNLKLMQNDKAQKAAIAKQVSDEEIRQLTIRNNYIQAAANIGAALAKDGTKEAFLIQKAAALAGVAIDDAKARSAATAQAMTLPPGASEAYLAKQFSLITSTTALSLSGIAASAIKGFANGGIVGATSGPDDQIASVRSGEMILNAEQQKSLFNAINSGGFGGDIIVQVDGREIARAVRNQVKAGYNLGVA